jgi:GTP:adenosylcobinamide-phosphate guanylyltransferase
MAEMNKKEHLPSFEEPIDAIVLAGTHSDPSRLILGQNKAFLDMDGQPLLRHVVDALTGAKSISNIFVVGPVEQVRDAMQGEPEKVHLVPQVGNMLDNGWAGIRASEAERAGDGRERDPMRPFLVISSDLPIISSMALDDFVARCADDEQSSNRTYGLMIGLADEDGLVPFSENGIVRPFVELDFARVRLANIYVARPWQLSNQAFLQTGFGFRKAVHWRNVAGLALSFLSQDGGWQAAWLTLRLQATLLATRRGGRLYRRLRRWNTRERVEAGTGKVLGGAVRLVVTPFGGLSLDVDDGEDFRILTARYHEWMAIDQAVKSEYPPLQSGSHQSG